MVASLFDSRSLRVGTHRLSRLLAPRHGSGFSAGDPQLGECRLPPSPGKRLRPGLSAGRPCRDEFGKGRWAPSPPEVVSGVIRLRIVLRQRRRLGDFAGEIHKDDAPILNGRNRAAQGRRIVSGEGIAAATPFRGPRSRRSLCLGIFFRISAALSFPVRFVERPPRSVASVAAVPRRTGRVRARHAHPRPNAPREFRAAIRSPIWNRAFGCAGRRGPLDMG